MATAGRVAGGMNCVEGYRKTARVPPPGNGVPITVINKLCHANRSRALSHQVHRANDKKLFIENSELPQVPHNIIIYKRLSDENRTIFALKHPRLTDNVTLAPYY